MRVILNMKGEYLLYASMQACLLSLLSFMHANAVCGASYSLSRIPKLITQSCIYSATFSDNSLGCCGNHFITIIHDLKSLELIAS